MLKAVFGFEGKVAKWDALDPTLKSYAQLASAGVIGCSWCLDFGYFMAHNDGLDLAKVREVPRWRESDVFTPLERDVLEYAEAMSTTPLTVTDEMAAAPARPARRAGGRRAHPDGRAGEHALALQLRRRAAEPGIFGCLRAAARRTVGSRTASAPDATDVFVAHRNLLFTVAYEMLGSAADAEDVLQETWLRWVDVDRAEVRDDRAYLVRIATRLALNRMRTNARRRESYVGPWLPEPLLTTPDVAEDVELADSVSLAMLTGARDAGAHRAGGVRAARGLRLRLRRDRGRGRQVTGRRTPDRQPGTGARRRAAAPRADATPAERDRVLAAVPGRRGDR